MPKETLNYKDSYLVIGNGRRTMRIKLKYLYSQSAFANKHDFTPQNVKNHIKLHPDKYLHIYDKQNGINLIAELDSE
jgi:hypothetical protein